MMVWGLVAHCAAATLWEARNVQKGHRCARQIREMMVKVRALDIADDSKIDTVGSSTY